MSRQRDEERFAERLRGAFTEGCPAPEVFLEAEWVRLPASERERIEAHAATCPACAAERDLAAAWDLPFDAGDVSDPDLAYVVHRIQEAQTERAPAPRSNVVAFPGARTQEIPSAPEASPRRAPRAANEGRPARANRSYAAWGLALAAVLALGIGLLIEWRQRAPGLPSPIDGSETTRGSNLLLQGPEGEIAKAPEVLGWEPVAGAVSYRVRIADPLDEEVWKLDAKLAPVALPAAVRAKLQTAVVYAWTVEAFDADGDRLATAEPLRFRIAP